VKLLLNVVINRRGRVSEQAVKPKTPYNPNNFQLKYYKWTTLRLEKKTNDPENPKNRYWFLLIISIFSLLFIFVFDDCTILTRDTLNNFGDIIMLFYVSLSCNCTLVKIISILFFSTLIYFSIKGLRNNNK